MKLAIAIATALSALPACEPGCLPTPEQHDWCRFLHGLGTQAIGRVGTEGACGAQDFECVVDRSTRPIEAADAGAEVACLGDASDAAQCAVQP